MLLHIPNVLTAEQITIIQNSLIKSTWIDGGRTAGAQASQVKQNQQLDPTDKISQQLSQLVLSAIEQNSLFISAALPSHILPPRFNRYRDTGHYGNHVDSAIHGHATLGKIRTDISITVFLNSPDDYEGGELIIEDTYGEHVVKLDAGDAILYPSTSLHRVEPVTHGERLASFFWVQSMVSDVSRRDMLFQLDMTILKLRQSLGDTSEVVSLTSHYHNLLRQWVQL